MELKDFFEAMSPECIQTSGSERITLQGNTNHERKPLFEGYYEVRTYYFPAGLSRTQRAALEMAITPQPGLVHGGPLAYVVGPTTWCWLKSLRLDETHMACGLRIIFRWNTNEIEQHHKSEFAKQMSRDSTVSCFQRRSRLIGVSRRALKDAGLLGSESYHCTFLRGRFS